METVFTAAIFAIALTGLWFGGRSFYNYWKNYFHLRKLCSGYLGWSSKAKAAPEYKLMWQSLSAFFAWSCGTIILTNVVLVPLRNWLF